MLKIESFNNLFNSFLFIERKLNRLIRIFIYIYIKFLLIMGNCNINEKKEDLEECNSDYIVLL